MKVKLEVTCCIVLNKLVLSLALHVETVSGIGKSLFQMEGTLLQKDLP